VQADRLNLITLINANGWGKWQCKNEFLGMKRSVFLDHVRKVSASTQNQALNALVFLYKKVLKIPLDNFDFKHARIGKRLPVVLSRDETDYYSWGQRK